MVARTPSGEVKTFPSAANHHEHQILVWSVIPSSIPPSWSSRPADRAAIADELKLEGLLAVEMFVTKEGNS